MKKIWLVLGIVLILIVFLWLMAIPSAPRPKMRGVMPEAHEAKPPEPLPSVLAAGLSGRVRNP